MDMFHVTSSGSHKMKFYMKRDLNNITLAETTIANIYNIEFMTCVGCSLF